MVNYDYYVIYYIDIGWKIKVQGTSSFSNMHLTANDTSSTCTWT